MANKGFQVLFLQDVDDFLSTLSPKVREKIIYNVRKVKSGVMDADLFKKLDGSDDIWEFRTKYNGMEYRLLAFWDKTTNSLVVATHGLVKKTWAVPASEIAKAEAIRKEYYESKDK
ncbi:MAG: type II toxin-antitoxin system RelE/ParE family toxin [Prevotella sp.]|nr:type II toxin-antitoxin system RelE/ParE family toxin [Prevotella sp.]